MSSKFNAGHIFIPLPRPEYVALPEGFISSLAWRALEISNLPAETDSGKKIGYRYKINGSQAHSKSVHFVETMPKGGDLLDLNAALEKHGLVEIGNKALLAEAVVNSVKGASAPKSKFSPASPLSPSLALLQNPIGLMGKRNPPDLARIFEVIYSLGRDGKPLSSVSDQWLQANKVRLNNDSLLSAIDAAFSEVVWKNGITESENSPVEITSELTQYLVQTPFGWFADTWEKITSEDWVLSLPSRVWVDWATGVLRTGFAMAYLWESSWYEALGRSILLSSEPTEGFLNQVLQSMEPPLTWRSSETPAEIRDVSSKLKWRCYKAVKVREVLEGWVSDQNASEMPLADFIEAIRSDSSALAALQDALTPDKDASSGSADNLWEAIRYSLKSRDKTDYYGFLESSGARYLFPAPGIEWGAMFASLSSRSAGLETNLGEVAEALARSGTQPQTKELLSLLEKSGLARGSADADLAVAVESAYKSGKAAK
jgi:hypothetical protein